MSFSNAIIKNLNKEGDILNYFNNTLRNYISKNGGDNTFSMITEDFHVQDPPMNVGLKTKIKLTNPTHSISQIEKGFINITLDLILSLNYLHSIKGKINDPNEFYQIFVGFKNAVEFFSEIRFYIDEQLIDYAQNDAIRESFAYNSIRPKNVKKNSINSHSLWEDVQNFSSNVCGVYVPLVELINSKKVKVQLELIIPFTDQLAIHSWQLYPNRILGEIEEEVKTSLDALVWCFVSPKNVCEKKRKLCLINDWENMIEFPDFIPFTQHFTQIGNYAKIIRSIEEISKPHQGDDELSWNKNYDNYITSKLGPLKYSDVKQNHYNYWQVGFAKLNCEGGRIQIARSNCCGFGLKNDVEQNLMSTFEEPLIIPTQEIKRIVFDQRAEKNGFTHLAKTLPLNNVSKISMMFPRHSNDCTVFQNIMYENCQLFVGQRLYPDTMFETTWDGRFLNYQLMSNQLDGPIEATDEFINSICLPLNDSKRIFSETNDPNTDKPPAGDRLNTITDNTSFQMNFQIERGNCGYTFDGIQSNENPIIIQFKGQPRFQGEDDSYYYPEIKEKVDHQNVVFDIEINEDIHPPPPEMWLSQTTYWVWSIQDGVKYYQYGIPSGYN